jgi:hypothetical protein
VKGFGFDYDHHGRQWQAIGARKCESWNWRWLD